jgi:hypothetical protein
VADDLHISVDPSHLRFDKVNRTILGRHVLFQQYYDGLPVSNGWIRVDLDKNDRVYNVQNDTVPMEVVEKSAKLSVAAAEAAPTPGNATKIALQQSVFNQCETKEVLESQLVHYPYKHQPRLAWKIVVRGGGGPDATHPFGRGQEKFFWALVSAVSVFFIGCGVNIYHGVDALWAGHAVEPFTPLVLGLLLFALALESYTFRVAIREIGGWKGVRENRTNTTVLAVVLEDAVALLGILLTLIVAGVSYVYGPRPIFDAVVAIAVGVLLGAMAIFLAALNRKLLIDASDPAVNRLAASFFAEHALKAEVSSVVVDDGHSIVFVRIHDTGASGAVAGTAAVAAWLLAAADAALAAARAS